MSPSFSLNYRNRDLVLGALAGRVKQPTDIAQSEKALLSVNEGSLYFHLKEYLLESVDEAQERAQGIFDRFFEHNRDWFDETFIQRRRGWVAQIFDRQRGKCALIASGDRIVLKIADWKVVLSGNKLIEKDGRKKVVVAGRGGTVIRLG